MLRVQRRPKSPPAGACRKIRLYPSAVDRLTLNEWFGAARWTYNKSLEYINSKKAEDSSYTVNSDTKQELRDHFTTRAAMERHPEIDWEPILRVPVTVRQSAVDDLIKAYNSNFAKRILNPDHKFEFKFRSKKHSERETIRIDCQSIQ